MMRLRAPLTLMIAAFLLVMQNFVSAGPAVVRIQPGSRITVVDLAGPNQAIGSCSVGYVFDGKRKVKGKVFIATAAHCMTDPGDDVMLLETGEAFGEYAVLGSSDSAATDWALIEVFPEYQERVSPAFKGYPQYPVGYTTPDDAAAGDAIRQTDWPYGGLPREAILTEMDEQVYVLEGPVIPFDSGGPLAHMDSGFALGLVSQGQDCPLPSLHCASYTGPTIQTVLKQATAAGFPITLRTVE
ncbi:MAG: hypothetical protein ABR505_05140 [Actinomycetota bacterium]